MEKSCVVYCYSSADEVERLSGIAQRQHWTVASVITESPATAPDRRSGLAAIRRMVCAGGVEAVVVPSLLMCGSTVDEAVALIAKMVDAGVHVIAEAENINSTSVGGWERLSGIAALDGFQRALRRQKARAGQLRAKEAGIRFGRPPISTGKLEQVRQLLTAGTGVRPTSRKTGVSASRVQTEKRAMDAARNG